MGLSLQSGRNTNSNSSTQDESWKAQAFLNFFIAGKKLGSIPLKTSNKSENQLIEWLTADPERIEKLMGKLECNFKLADDPAAKGFDLS